MKGVGLLSGKLASFPVEGGILAAALLYYKYIFEAEGVG